MAMSENPNREPAGGWLPDRLTGSADLDRGDRGLVALLELATAPATREELASEPAVLAAYHATFVPTLSAAAAPAVPYRTVTPVLADRADHGTSWIRRLAARSTAAAVAIVATLSLGGVATAAYTGALPAPLQDFAHRHIGAPAVGHGIWAHHTNPHAAPKPPAFAHSHPGGSHGRRHVGAAPQAAVLARLCKAYVKGHLGPASAEYPLLVAAAHGADKVTAYCANLPGPGKPPQRPAASVRPHPSATDSGAASQRPKPTPSG